MNLADRLLAAIKTRQAAFALAALKQPSDRTEFEYGYRAGTVAGYESSLEILYKLLQEEKDGGNEI